MAYAESGSSGSNTFRDFIGLPNVLWKLGHFTASIATQSRQSSDKLDADASYILLQEDWPGWVAMQQYTITTLPGLVATLGGLWSAFSGVFLAIFGTSFAFIVWGSKPISISPLLAIGRRTASSRLDERYLGESQAIDEEIRQKALAAFLADFVVDTGELDLQLGRIPQGIRYRNY